MIQRDIELILGRMVAGELTPSIFLLFKDTPYMDMLCADLGIKEEFHADTCGDAATTANDDSRVNLKDWLANNGQPITL